MCINGIHLPLNVHVNIRRINLMNNTDKLLRAFIEASDYDN